MTKIKLNQLIKLKSGYAFKSEYFSDEGVPIIRIGNLINNIVNLDNLVFYPRDYIGQLGDYKLNNQDILIAMSGATVGKIAKFIDNTKGNYLLNQRVGKFELISKDIINDYLYYLVQSDFFKKQIIRQSAGCAQPNISSNQIGNIEINLPSLKEQKQIVSQLEKLEKLKEKKEQNIQRCDELIKSIFYDMFGDPNKNEKRWGIKKLSQVCEINRGSSPRPIEDYLTDDKNGINWIKIGDTKKHTKYIYQTQEKIKPEGTSKSRFVNVGDFLLSNSMSFGRPYIMKTTGCIHDGWLLLRINNNKELNPHYLYAILSSSYLYNEFAKSAKGATVNNLNIELVKKISISVPGIDRQNLFARKVEKMEKLKEKQIKSKEEIDNLFNGLMQKYFNGD